MTYLIGKLSPRWKSRVSIIRFRFFDLRDSLCFYGAVWLSQALHLPLFTLFIIKVSNRYVFVLRPYIYFMLSA